MSILISETNNQPAILTVEQTVDRVNIKMLRQAANTFQYLSDIQKDGINTLWNNPRATPQQIIDGLGDKALKLFQFHGALTDLLVGMSVVDGISYTPSFPTNAFTIDPNTGKITVTEDPYVYTP